MAVFRRSLFVGGKRILIYEITLNSRQCLYIIFFFRNLKKKKNCAFLDFEKVFGKVWTEALRVVHTSIK